MLHVLFTLQLIAKTPTLPRDQLTPIHRSDTMAPWKNALLSGEMTIHNTAILTS
jgi:hypothetical protein